MATFMDPRFKMKAFSEQHEAVKTKEKLVKLVSSVISQRTANSAQVQTDTVINDKAEKDELSAWEIFDEMIGQDRVQGTPLSMAIKEVDMYLSDEILPRKNSSGGWNCPIEWWKQQRCVYPNLTEVFIKSCNIVATSVPCERMFSKSGLIINQRRSRLTTDKVEKLIILNVNMNPDRFN